MLHVSAVGTLLDFCGGTQISLAAGKGRSMKFNTGPIGVITLASCLFAGSTGTMAATVHLRAVQLNGTVIAPTQELDVGAGDIVETEITLSGWNPTIGTVKTYQITFDLASIIDSPWSGGCGSIKPLNFDEESLRSTGAFFDIAFLSRGVCSADSADAGASCVADPVACDGGTCMDGLCVGGANAGRLCATSYNQCDSGPCISHPDFLFADVASPACGTATFDATYMFGCTDFLEDGPASPSRCVDGAAAGDPCDRNDDCPGGACEEIEFYVGTLILVVGEDAAGTFFLDIVPSPRSFLVGTEHDEVLETHTPLTLHTPEPCVRGACCLAIENCQDMNDSECAAAGGIFGGADTHCGGDTDFCRCPSIVAAVPDNCAIDARYPYEQGYVPGARDIGLDSVEITLSDGARISLIGPGSFRTILMSGSAEARPEVAAVTPLGGRAFRVDFDKPFPARRWTCLAMACAPRDHEDVCWGHLPGDVCGDGAATPADVLCLIDGLNGDRPLDWYQCDVDDSGDCNASDILAVIDLLNGAGTFVPWNNVPIDGGACPTAP